MKRFVLNGILMVVIALTGSFSAGAQGRGPQRPGPGGVPGGGRGPIGFARLADLTDEQQQQVQAILEAERASRQGPPATMELHRQLEAEILADAPNDQKIDALQQQLVQAQAEQLARQIGVQRKIAQVLTSEQRAKARERLAEAPRGRRGH